MPSWTERLIQSDFRRSACASSSFQPRSSSSLPPFVLRPDPFDRAFAFVEIFFMATSVRSIDRDSLFVNKTRAMVRFFFAAARTASGAPEGPEGAGRRAYDLGLWA